MPAPAETRKRAVLVKGLIKEFLTEHRISVTKVTYQIRENPFGPSWVTFIHIYGWQPRLYGCWASNIIDLADDYHCWVKFHSPDPSYVGT